MKDRKAGAELDGAMIFREDAGRGSWGRGVMPSARTPMVNGKGVEMVKTSACLIKDLVGTDR